MTWKYLVANVILKYPFADENGKQKAYIDLIETINKISPSVFHDSQFTVIPIDKLPENHVENNGDDKRDCGCE